MRLYRAHPAGRFGTAGEFWATDPAYPAVVHGPDAEQATATLDARAIVLRLPENPGEARVQELLADSHYDFVVWPCLDGPGEQGVVLNPYALQNLTRQG